MRPFLGLCGLLISFVFLGLTGTSSHPPPQEDEVWANTFSIVAHDPEKKEWGVAVASRYLAVGAVVPWAEAGVGAVATQSAVNTSYGPRGLELMAEGQSAEEVLKTLTELDRGNYVAH